jgi:hypothetical protein
MHHGTMKAAIALILGSAFASVAAAAPGVAVQQGGVARWTGMAAATCGFHGKRYPAVDATCYYPVDIAAKAARHEIALIDQDGKQHIGFVDVEAVEWPKIDITMDDDTYVKPSEENLARHGEERKRVLALLRDTYEDEPKFSLPLAKPAGAMPGSEDDFGSKRLFNGTRASQHTGRDFPVGAGVAVKAVADGTVVLAEEQFFTGNTVFVEHGGGLISMNFHLASLDVKTGDEVKRGATLGKVGSTGRSTGPHLHLGFRWVGARIDPLLLLNSPDQLPTVGDSAKLAEKKIETATEREPPEVGDEEE